jgi:hypothetical protein
MRLRLRFLGEASQSAESSGDGMGQLLVLAD